MELIRILKKTRQRSKQMSKKTIIAAAAVVIAAAGVLVCLVFIRDRHLWALEE